MKRFYVVGSNASKSLSPTIFNYWFKKYKIRASYGFLELNEKNFDKKIKEVLQNKETQGLNITIPFKQKIIKHADILDKHSKTIDAVNCLTVGKKIKGKNTDWVGYFKSLPNEAKQKNKKILIIGYGGAALAIHYAFINKGYRNITIVNRTRKKLKFIKQNRYTLSTKDISEHIPKANLIINTTPKNPINFKNRKLVRKDTILSDIVYKPKETAFLKQFSNHKKIYGISMLVHQATPCFNLWFGFKPSVDKELINILNNKI